MATLDAMEERALRHLDGMTVNRDAMARDVIALVAAIRAARQRSHDASPTRKAGSFSDAFGDLFKFD